MKTNVKLKKAELEIVRSFNALYMAIGKDVAPETLMPYIAGDEAETVIYLLERIAAVHAERRWG
jgi:hypothetical protein